MWLPCAAQRNDFFPYCQSSENCPNLLPPATSKNRVNPLRTCDSLGSNTTPCQQCPIAPFVHLSNPRSSCRPSRSSVSRPRTWFGGEKDKDRMLRMTSLVLQAAHWTLSMRTIRRLKQPSSTLDPAKGQRTSLRPRYDPLSVLIVQHKDLQLLLNPDLS